MIRIGKGKKRIYTVLCFSCTGVMAARGIMRNPAMYAGFDETPLQCIQDWVSSPLYFTLSILWECGLLDILYGSAEIGWEEIHTDS